MIDLHSDFDTHRSSRVRAWLRKHSTAIPFLGIVLLLLRAWPRILSPQIWCEDGTQNLLGFIQNGAKDLFHPVNGYLILVPKIITFLSASLSITQYPLISTLLAWASILSVFYFITSASLRLRGGVLLAVLCFLVPSDAEVFGLPLYTFWWASVPLLAIPFWSDDESHWRTRTAAVFLGSLSSPVCVIVLPLMWLRVLLLRFKRVDIGLALVSSTCTALQLGVMYSMSTPTAHVPALSKAYLVVPKFIGSYTTGNLFPNAQWVLGIVTILLVVAATYRDVRSSVKLGLIYLWGAAVAISIARNDVGILHPVLAGPRYFFFPFIILSWLLLQIAYSEPNRWLRGAACLTLGLSIVNALPVLTRHHVDLHWREHLESCLVQGTCTFPILSDGNADSVWHIDISKQQCAALMSHDIFYRRSIRKGQGLDS